jgi:hypothetical protein
MTPKQISMMDHFVFPTTFIFHHHVRHGHALKRLHAQLETSSCQCQHGGQTQDTNHGGAPSTFQLLMTLHLTDHTTPKDVRKAIQLKNEDKTPAIVGCKHHPAGATAD